MFSEWIAPRRTTFGAYRASPAFESGGVEKPSTFRRFHAVHLSQRRSMGAWVDGDYNLLMCIPARPA